MNKKTITIIVALALCFVMTISFCVFKPSEKYTVEVAQTNESMQRDVIRVRGVLPEVFEFGGDIEGERKILFSYISDQPNLRRLIIKEGVICVDELVNCPNLEYIELGKDVEDFWVGYGYPNSNYSVKEFVVHPDNPHLKVVDRCLVHKSNNSVARAPKDINAIPEVCTQIDIGAFMNTDIALQRDSLKNITRIRDDAFTLCDNITSIYFPENVAIGGSVLEGCKNLKCVYLPGSAFRDHLQSTTPFWGLSPKTTIYCGNLEDYLPQIKEWYRWTFPFAVDSVEAFMKYWGFDQNQTILFGKTADDMERDLKATAQAR